MYLSKKMPILWKERECVPKGKFVSNSSSRNFSSTPCGMKKFNRLLAYYTMRFFPPLLIAKKVYMSNAGHAAVKRK